jgi:hypothetical protein
VIRLMVAEVKTNYFSTFSEPQIESLRVSEIVVE